MNTRHIDRVDSAHAGKNRWNDRAGEFVNEFSEGRIFLGRSTDDGKGPDRIFAMINIRNLHPGEGVSQRVVA